LTRTNKYTDVPKVESKVKCFFKNLQKSQLESIPRSVTFLSYYISVLSRCVLVTGSISVKRATEFPVIAVAPASRCPPLILAHSVAWWSASGRRGEAWEREGCPSAAPRTHTDTHTHIHFSLARALPLALHVG